VKFSRELEINVRKINSELYLIIFRRITQFLFQCFSETEVIPGAPGITSELIQSVFSRNLLQSEEITKEILDHFVKLYSRNLLLAVEITKEIRNHLVELHILEIYCDQM